MIAKISLVICIIGLAACHDTSTADLEKTRQEVMAAEKAFNDMAATNGVKAAFLHFADSSAVLNRRGQIVKGKQAISDYFDTWNYSKVSLTWSPDFVDVSKSGDLAYTFGNYAFEATDSSGQSVSDTGVFHTVWRKQADGQWKYVYD